MKIKNPEDYYSNFKINKTLSLPQTQMYYLDFTKKFPKSGYPDSSYLKVIKNKNKEFFFHQQISSIIPQYSLKIFHTIEYDSTTEAYIETTENGQLSKELNNFTNFPEHYISKAVYQLSFALKLLHQRKIYLANINDSNIFISSFLKFGNFNKAGKCYDDNGRIPVELRGQIDGIYIPEKDEIKIDFIDEEKKRYEEVLGKYKQILPGIVDMRQYDVFCLGFIFLQFFIGKQDLNVKNDAIKIIQLFENKHDKIKITVIKRVLSEMLKDPPTITMSKVISKITFKQNYLETRRFGPMCFYCFEENIVNDERGDNEIRNFLCPHFFHNGCMRNYLKSKLKEIKSLEELECKFCPQAFPYELERIIQKFDFASRFKSEKLFYRTQDFNCPNGHHCLTQKMLNLKLKPYKVSCPICLRSYCSYCGEVHHWLKFNRCNKFQELEVKLREELIFKTANYIN